MPTASQPTRRGEGGHLVKLLAQMGREVLEAGEPEKTNGPDHASEPLERDTAAGRISGSGDDKDYYTTA